MSKKLTFLLTKGMLSISFIFVFLFASFGICLSAHAQKRHQIAVNIVYPPGLGIKVNKIAFGPAAGKCSDQLISTFISDFVTNKIEVVDRENLNAILAEHDLTLSGFVNRSSATAIGKIIGPSALVFVKVQRCATEEKNSYRHVNQFNYRDGKTYSVPIYYSKTRAYLKASIQVVDLATGRIFAAQTLDYSPEKTNASYEGYPEFPDKFDIQDIAFREAALQVHRMFFPWTEKQNLYYYSDKACGLKNAFKALRYGNLELAFELSKKNLEKCKKAPKIKDKTLGHANYNMGMSYMIKNNYDKALEYFHVANKLSPNKIIVNAITISQKAKLLATAMQQIDKKADFETAQQKVESKKAELANLKNILTNADIIKLTQQKLPNLLIIEKIKTSNCKFDTSTDALLKLTKSHVSNDVIIEMMNKK